MSAPGPTAVITHVTLLVKAGSNVNVMKASNFRPTASHVEVSKDLKL